MAPGVSRPAGYDEGMSPGLPHLILVAAGLLSAAAEVRATTTGAESTSIRLGPMSYRRGDDPDWSRPEYDDASWESRRLVELPHDPTLFWLRQSVILDERPAGEVRGISFSILGSFQMFWDGVLLGDSGVVGSDRASEVPGPIRSVFAIPSHLAGPGEHDVAIRVSNHHYHGGFLVWCYGGTVSEYARLVGSSRDHASIPLPMLGALLLAALIFLLRFAIERRGLPSLLFGLLCLAVAALLIAESWRGLFGYPYHHHVRRIVLIACLTFVVSFLLVLYTCWQFRISRKPIWFATTAVALALAWALIPGYDNKGTWMLLIGLLVAAAAMGCAFRRQRQGASFGLLGLAAEAAFLIVEPERFHDQGFFLGFPIFAAALLVPLAMQRRDADRQREQTRLRAARLENELLRRSLQPHFLMNSLTTAIEQIERDPEAGARLVEALAEEARLLADMASERTVPLHVELDLCRRHLEIMSARKERRFALDVRVLDEGARVPPAILHTLIENGITHDDVGNGDVRFLLKEERSAGRRRYTLAGPRGAAGDEGVEGTGLRYVKARLEESFPGDWQFDGGARDGCWVTSIDLPLSTTGDGPFEATPCAS